MGVIPAGTSPVLECRVDLVNHQIRLLGVTRSLVESPGSW